MLGSLPLPAGCVENLPSPHTVTERSPGVPGAAQSVKCWTLGFGCSCDLGVVGPSSSSGSVLSGRGGSETLPLSLLLPHFLSKIKESLKKCLQILLNDLWGAKLFPAENPWVRGVKNLGGVVSGPHAMSRLVSGFQIVGCGLYFCIITECETGQVRSSPPFFLSGGLLAPHLSSYLPPANPQTLGRFPPQDICPETESGPGEDPCCGP